MLDAAAIIKTATCKKNNGVYCVESPLFDRLLGADETEGEAWKLFFELLDEYVQADTQGTLVKNAAARALGRRGRSVNSPAQIAAARKNGAKGGRPRKAV